MIAPVTPVAPCPSDTLPPQPAIPSLDSNECPQYLKDFFQDKKPLTDSPVSQFEIDFLTTKENDAVPSMGFGMHVQKSIFPFQKVCQRKCYPHRPKTSFTNWLWQSIPSQMSQKVLIMPCFLL